MGWRIIVWWEWDWRMIGQRYLSLAGNIKRKAMKTEEPKPCHACYRNISNRRRSCVAKQIARRVVRRKDQYRAVVMCYSVTQSTAVADQQLIDAPSLHITWVVERACETRPAMQRRFPRHCRRTTATSTTRRQVDPEGRSCWTHWPHRTRNLIRPRPHHAVDDIWTLAQHQRQQLWPIGNFTKKSSLKL